MGTNKPINSEPVAAEPEATSASEAEAEPEPESEDESEDEVDQMMDLDAAMIAAEDLKTEVSQTDDATESEKKEANEESPMKLEVDENGNLKIQGGASSLIASAITIIAASSIIC